MNKTLRSIIRIVSFTLILFLILSIIYKVLSWKDTTGNYLSSAQQLYSTEDNLVDAAFVGTSHVYCGIYPSIIWEQYGYATFDMAISGQDKNSAVHSIIELCKTQSPKIVFVDMYALVFDGYYVEGNLYRNTMAFKTSSNSVSLVKDITDKSAWKDYITRWPIIHTRYNELDKYDYIQYQPSIYGRGEFFSSGTYSDMTLPYETLNDTYIAELSDENKAWLDELTELSKSNNFQLVFLTIPFSESMQNQEIFNGAKQYAEQNGIQFLDMNTVFAQSGLNLATDFNDANHLNYKGASKLSAYLGSWLAANTDLSDMRGDSEYELWNEDYKWYKHNMLNIKFNEISSDLSQTASLIAGAEDLTTIISIEGNDLSECPFLYLESLSVLGITESDLETGGKWKYEDGCLTKLMDNDITAESVVLQLSDTDIMEIRFNGQLYKDNIRLNYEERNHTDTNLTLISYDKFLEKIVVDTNPY